MNHLNEFPKQGPNCSIEQESVAKFREAITSCGEFVFQSKPEKDYGTDFTIEAREPDGMTNTTISVQLKGTKQGENKDGSVSVSIKRTNLNYQLMSSGSLYVCYHSPTKRLLVKQADELFRIYEHKGDRWRVSVRESI